MPSFIITPISNILIALLVYIIFAIGTCENIKQALIDETFWIGLTRKSGTRFIIVSGCFLLVYTTLYYLLWELRSSPSFNYRIWDSAQLPMGALYTVCSIIVGVMAGREYSAMHEHPEGKPPESQSVPATRESGWLYTSSGDLKRLWRWLAIIGSLPALITLIIVIQGSLERGICFAPSDRSYIDNVEWTSDHKITFGLVGLHLTDCVGCGYEHSVYIIDINTGKADLVEREYFSRGFPETRVFDDSAESPDKSRLAYVANRYDLYIKESGDRLFPIHRVYKYPNTNFFERKAKKLVSGLLISSLVGIALVFPYFYANRKNVLAQRGFAVMVIWNLSLFAGTLVFHHFMRLNIYHYLWKGIP